MKEWKENILKELENQTTDLREISFKDTVLKLGYKHIKHEDILDIVVAFTKRNPTYKAIKFVEEKSLFNGLVFTELDYSNQETEEKIRNYFGEDISDINVKNGIVDYYMVNGIRCKELDDTQKAGEVYRFQFDFNKMRKRETSYKRNFYWTPWTHFKLDTEENC